MSQAFNQRIDDLNYEFDATIVKNLKTSTRIGRRNQFSLFEVPSGNPSADAYRAPVRGQVDTAYAVTSLNFEPSPRFTLGLSGDFDRQRGSGVATDARVASGSAHLEIVRGLSINAIGTYGERGQTIESVPVTVTARSGLIGGTYRAGLRWIEGSIGYSAGMGTSSTEQGRVGAMRSWAGNGNLSISISWFSVNGGYERSRNIDDILDFGNFFLDRGHAALQAQTGRFVLGASAEQARIERGRGSTYADNLQRSFTGTLSWKVGRNTAVSANAGGFRNEGTFGRDQMLFAGASIESQLLRSLHFSAWIRRGDTAAALTRMQQQTLYSFAQLGTGFGNSTLTWSTGSTTSS